MSTKPSPIFTRDDASIAEAQRTRFYAAMTLGEKQAVTPEGFLICFDVALARTGIMWYAESELLADDGEPLIPGIDGKVQIVRDEAEVFRPEFVASFAGKPVVNDHPPEQVRPENWKTYAVGTIFNPRRGVGMQTDLLLGDLIIYDPAAISDIRSGKREVSCGYDAEYEETGPGQGRQYDMVGNHVALVESGRCGPRCSIGDRKTSGDTSMKTTLDHRTVDDAGAGRKSKVRAWFKDFTDGLREAMKKGGSAFDEYLANAANSPERVLTNDEEGGGGESALHLHLGGGEAGGRKMTDEEIGKGFEEIRNAHKDMRDMLEGMAKHVGYEHGAEAQDKRNKDEELVAPKEIEGSLKEEAPEGTTDAAIRAHTKDSVLLEDAYNEAVALAEVLVPGARPTKTFDKAAPAKATMDAICGFRRTVLDLAYHQAEGRAMIDQVTGGKPFDPKAGSCSQIKTLFRAASALRKSANDAMLRGQRQAQNRTDAPKAPTNAEELNALHRKHYGYEK